MAGWLASLGNIYSRPADAKRWPLSHQTTEKRDWLDRQWLPAKREWSSGDSVLSDPVITRVGHIEPCVVAADQ